VKYEEGGRVFLPAAKKPGFAGLRCRSGPAGALRAPYNPSRGQKNNSLQNSPNGIIKRLIEFQDFF
jgi:hypothetical protein